MSATSDDAGIYGGFPNDVTSAMLSMLSGRMHGCDVAKHLCESEPKQRKREERDPHGDIRLVK